MQAHPAGINGQVWGGFRTFAPEQRYEVFRAVTRFVRDYPDPKAAVIPIFLFGMPGNMLNALTGPFVFMFYDGPSPPPGALDDFLAIKPMIDTTKTRSYYDLTQELGGADFIGFSQAFRVATFPNLEENAMTAFLDGAWNTTFSETFASGLQNFFDLQLTTWEPQPLSRRIQEASLAQGGNALGLDPRQGDKIWMITTRMWMNPLSHPQHESKQFLDGKQYQARGIPISECPTELGPSLATSSQTTLPNHIRIVQRYLLTIYLLLLQACCRHIGTCMTVRALQITKHLVMIHQCTTVRCS